MKNKKQIYLLSWYFSSLIGGAENSILEVLKEYKKKGYEIKVISFDELYKESKFNINGINGINYKLKYNYSHLSRYLTLFLNRNYFKSVLAKNYSKIKTSEFIITQSISAPVIASFCIDNKIKYHYYIRDENNLNEFHNYEIGIRRFLKFIKDILEFPFKKYYSISNIKALKNSSKIISNSKFIASLLMKKYNLKSDIQYPKIDFSKLDKKLMKKSNQKYIAFIGGGNAMKGYDIVLKIAKQMPEYKFLIVGGVKEKIIKDNITYIPNQKDIMQIYKQTKVLLVPSRWMEAFGRVVEEVNYLGIPAITSNRGGLLEANKNKNNIINDLNNINFWVKKIKLQ